MGNFTEAGLPKKKKNICLQNLQMMLSVGCIAYCFSGWEGENETNIVLETVNSRYLDFDYLE